MKILLVLDQYDDDNNGTTMTARRLASVLETHGHQVFVVSTGKPGKNKYVVKEVFLLPVARHIVHEQGMRLAKADTKILREAIREVDIVHFIMPFQDVYKRQLAVLWDDGDGGFCTDGGGQYLFCPVPAL